MKTTTQTPPKANGNATKPTDTKEGIKVAATTLNVEKRENETKPISELIDRIRKKNKLVNDLQTTATRREALALLASGERGEKLTITVGVEDSHRGELVFTNPDVLDYIISMLIEKSKEVETDIVNQIRELEK